MSWKNTAPYVGLLLILAGLPVYMALASNPTIRSTAWPTFVLAAIGSVVAIWAAIQNKTITSRIVAGGCVALTLSYVFMFFVVAATPQSKTFDTLVTAPDFTLADADGKKITLSDAYAQGPVLLVFYRGHW